MAYGSLACPLLPRVVAYFFFFNWEACAYCCVLHGLGNTARGFFSYSSTAAAVTRWYLCGTRVCHVVFLIQSMVAGRCISYFWWIRVWFDDVVDCVVLRDKELQFVRIVSFAISCSGIKFKLRKEAKSLKF